MEVACAELGAPPGVAVTVDKAIAADVDDVRLTVCWDSRCDDHEVQLAPGSDTLDQGCGGWKRSGLGVLCDRRTERHQGGFRRHAWTDDGHHHDQCNGTQSRQAGRAARNRRTVQADLSKWTAVWPTGSPGPGGRRGLGLALSSQRTCAAERRITTNSRRPSPQRPSLVASPDGSRQAGERTPPNRIRAARPSWPAHGCHLAANPSRGPASA